MRAILSLLFSALFLAVPAGAQQIASQGLSCFENLAAPEYPRTALRSGIDGSVWTWTQVSPQGTVDKIETQVVSAWGNGPQLLTPPVEKAIRAAKIKSECAGKTVAVTFRYNLQSEATPNPKVTSRIEAPNLMWIEGQPLAATGTAGTAPARP